MSINTVSGVAPINKKLIMETLCYLRSQRHGKLNKKLNSVSFLSPSIYFAICCPIILYINVNQIQFQHFFFPPTSFKRSKDLLIYLPLKILNNQHMKCFGLAGVCRHAYYEEKWMRHKWKLRLPFLNRAIV